MSNHKSAVLQPEPPIAEARQDYKLPSAFLAKHQEAFYRTTLRSIGDAVIATDKDCLITFINPVAETLTGWLREEALGTPLSEIFKISTESDNHLLEDPATRVLRVGHTVSLPKGVLLNTRDGKKTPIDDSSALILDDDGDAIGAVVIFRDISLRKLGEDALRKSDKLATAGLLAATIAHEINNPLAAVTNLLFILRADPNLSESTQQNLEQMDRELSRVTLIAKQALGLHRNSVQARPINMRELLDELLVLYQGRLRSKSIILQKEYKSTVVIEGFEGDLKQVFSNLIANAIDAMGEDGVLSLRTKNSNDAECPGIKVQVGDNGAGIGAEFLERVFEPFYTTKDTGSGLGLWVVKQIIEEHGGSIRIQSRVHGAKHGACFSVCLPLIMQERPSVRMLAQPNGAPLQDRRR